MERIVMNTKKRTGQGTLSKKQRDVIADLFEGGMDEHTVMEKHNLSEKVYKKWLKEQAFQDELSWQMHSARRQSEMIISRYAPAAAAKLVSLTASEKEETARRACLDIMAQVTEQILCTDKPENQVNALADFEPMCISEDKQARILQILAEE
jgi:hypothetical protein